MAADRLNFVANFLAAVSVMIVLVAAEPPEPWRTVATAVFAVAVGFKLLSLLWRLRYGRRG